MEIKGYRTEEEEEQAMRDFEEQLSKNLRESMGCILDTVPTDKSEYTCPPPRLTAYFNFYLFPVNVKIIRMRAVG